MPTVPRLDQTPAGTAALPGVRVSTGAPAAAFGQPQSIDLGGVGRAAAEIIERERQKADQVAVLDADNKLAELETSLLYDPKAGALNRKGKNAFGAPEEVEGEWRKRVGEIEKGLSTERQQMAFQARVGARWQSVNQTLQRHVSGEIAAYDNETANAALANRYDAAIRSNGEPYAVETALRESKIILDAYGKRNGWSPEVMADKRVTLESRIHSGVIEQMLSQGRDRDASAYFTDNKASIAGPDLPKLERALEQASTDGAGMRAADAVWKELGPKSGNDAVKVATMEQKLRDTLGDDVKVIKAAISEVRSRAAAFNSQQAETTAANKAALLGAYTNGATLASIKTRPEYRALSGAEQEQLTSYLENRTEQDLTRKNFITFWSMSNPRALASMSEQTILSTEPTLGRTLVGQLMQMKRAIGAKSETADNRVLAATIDDDLFKTIATDAGLKPYATGLQDDEKEDLGRLKVAVESAIAREQERIDKPLTQAQKRDVMQGIVDQHVLRDGWGTSTPSTIAALVKRDDAGNLPSDIFVPVERVPEQYRTQALNWLRSVGAVREGTTDAQALRQLGERIGKAYAARLAGGTRAEIEQRLRGQR